MRFLAEKKFRPKKKKHGKLKPKVNSVGKSLGYPVAVFAPHPPPIVPPLPPKGGAWDVLGNFAQNMLKKKWHLELD